jgi:hypothetical protein
MSVGLPSQTPTLIPQVDHKCTINALETEKTECVEKLEDSLDNTYALKEGIDEYVYRVRHTAETRVEQVRLTILFTRVQNAPCLLFPSVLTQCVFDMIDVLIYLIFRMRFQVIQGAFILLNTPGVHTTVIVDCQPHQSCTPCLDTLQTPLAARDTNSILSGATSSKVYGIASEQCIISSLIDGRNLGSRTAPYSFPLDRKTNKTQLHPDRTHLLPLPDIIPHKGSLKIVVTNVCHWLITLSGTQTHRTISA